MDGELGEIARLTGVGVGGRTPTHVTAIEPLTFPKVAVKLTVPALMHWTFSVAERLTNAPIAALLVVHAAPAVTFCVVASEKVAVAVKPSVWPTFWVGLAEGTTTSEDTDRPPPPIALAVPPPLAVPPAVDPCPLQAVLQYSAMKTRSEIAQICLFAAALIGILIIYIGIWPTVVYVLLMSLVSVFCLFVYRLLGH